MVDSSMTAERITTGDASLSDDEITVEFAARLAGGTRPDIEDVLSRRDIADRTALFRELLLIETKHDRLHGKSVDAESYRTRFPEHSVVVDEVFSALTECPNARDGGKNGNRTDPNSFDSRNRFHAGPFREINLHASGGLGDVYRAHDGALNRVVALKRMQPRFRCQADAVRRFVLEAEITGCLEHPGVVPVYALGVDDSGEPYYAMRFIEGETMAAASRRLSDRPRQHGSQSDSLEFQKLLRAFLSACQAIAYAHSRGVIHRDIKPANIMLGDYGETLVVDWGLAKPIDSTQEFDSPGLDSGSLPSMKALDVTVEGSAKGSPTYMSPEQARGDIDQVGVRSDVYSLGATLYHLLTGHGPVRGSSVSRILDDVRQGRFPAPSVVNSRCPKPLEAVCLKAMAIDPADRYATATEMADDVERWLADEPVSAWSEPWATSIRRWIARRRAVVATVTAVVLSMLIALSVFAVYQHRHNQSLQASRDQQRKLKDRAEQSRTVALDAVKRMKAEQDDKESNLYVSHVNVAKQSFDRLQYVRSINLLQRHQPVNGKTDRRGFEWYYLWNCLHTAKVIYPPATARAICYSPDQQHLAIVGFFRKVILFDLKSGTRRMLTGHKKGVSSADFSPDGRYLATGSHDCEVLIWDVATGRLLERLKGHQRVVTTVRFLPRRGSHQLISAGDDKQILLWNADDKAWGSYRRNRRPAQVVGRHQRNIHGADISAAGDRVVSVSKDGVIKLWSLHGDSNRRSSLLKSIRMDQVIYPIRFCRNANAVAFGTESGRVYLWNWQRQNKPMPLGRPGRRQPHRSLIFGLAYDARHELLASSDRGGRVALWDLKSEKLLTHHRLHPGVVHCVDFSRTNDASGLQLATGGRVVQFWNVKALLRANFASEARGVTILTPPVHSRIAPKSRTRSRDIATCESQQLIAATAQNGRVNVWQRVKHERKVSFRRVVVLRLKQDEAIQAYSIAFSRDGRYLAAGGGNRDGRKQPGIVALWRIDPATGNSPLSIRPVRTWQAHGQAVNSVDFAVRNGRMHVATSSHDDTAIIWDLGRAASSRQPREPKVHRVIRNHKHWVWQARFSRDGKTLVTMGHDGATRLWDVETGRLTNSRLNREINAVGNRTMAFSNSGRFLIVAAGDSRVDVWDLVENARVRSIKCHASYITGLAVSADDKTIAVSTDTRTVELYSMKTGDELMTLVGSRSANHDIEFAFDDQMLLAVTGDGTVVVWHAPRD